MTSKGLLLALSLVVLLVTNCYPTCHARLLKGFVPSNNGINVLVATGSVPGLGLALPTRFSENSEQRPSLSGGGNDGGVSLDDDVEDTNKSKRKYMKLRTLVLASLPKGRTVPSGPSKRHNDFNT